ncbi:MAG TPA: flavodoxin family protein [Dehalococcoidales bacterium]|nr:flavodoxin family protein [Dehalococcoidales bacterium]
MNVVAIGASPRLNSNTSFLIDQVLDEIKREGINTEKFVLSRYKISPCYGHDDCGSLQECRIQDDAPAILEKVVEADAVILASPIYMYSVTAFMKIFMDRTYFFYTHDRRPKAKVAGFIAIGGGAGADETIQEMKKLLGPSKIRKLVLKGYTGEGDDVKTKPEIISEARAMGKEIAAILKTGKTKKQDKTDKGGN